MVFMAQNADTNVDTQIMECNVSHYAHVNHNFAIISVDVIFLQVNQIYNVTIET